MIAQSDEQEHADEKNDYRDTNRGAGEEFKMEIALAKKPVGDPAKERPSRFFWLSWYVGVGRLIYHNCHRAARLLPARLSQCRSAPSDPKADSVPHSHQVQTFGWRCESRMGMT